MEKIFNIATSLLLLFLANGKCTVKLNNINGGIITSPGYPRKYPSNIIEKYSIRAPRHYVIAIKFFDFITEDEVRGRRTDYVQIYDGRQHENPTVRYYQGRLATPFYFVSETNRVKLWLITNNQINEKGFRAFYSFIDTRTHCSVSSLETRKTTPGVCFNRVHDYSQTCTVECKENFRLVGSNIAACVEGEFSSVRCREFCSLETLQLTNSAVVSCDEEEGRASRCELACKHPYELSGSAISTCSHENFTPVTCQPKRDIVSQCEDIEMVDCPYSVEDIVKYYSENQLVADENLSYEERAEEEAVLREVKEPVVVARDGSYGCRRQYCRRSYRRRKLRYRFRCGRCRGKRQRMVCHWCRYKSSCSSGLPRRLF